jgi:fibronectin-binding autotransporter adhesin
VVRAISQYGGQLQQGEDTVKRNTQIVPTSQNRRPIRRVSSQRVALAAAALTGLVSNAWAAGATWTGSAGSTDWITPANWGGTAPVTTNSLIFTSVNASSSNTLTNTLTSTSFNVAGITFNSGALAYTMTGNAFGLTTGITNSGSTLETINDAMTLGGAVTFTTTTGGGNITLAGAMTEGANAITKLGAGTLILSGANTGSGATTIGTSGSSTSAGTLQLSGSGTLGSGGVNIDGTGTVLDLNGTTQSIGVLGGNGAGTDVGGVPVVTSSAGSGILTVNTGNNNDFGARNAQFTGTLQLIITGTGFSSTGTGNAFQLANSSNTFSGGLTAQGTSGSITASSLLSTGGVTDTTGQSIRVNGASGSGSAASNGAIVGTGTITLNNGAVWWAGNNDYWSITDAINVTANGGILHSENNGGTMTYSGALTSSSSAAVLAIINGFNSSNTFSGSWSSGSGFTGTFAIDTSNTTNINFSGNNLGNASAILEFYGTGANASTVQWTGTGSQTINFGELVSGPNGGGTSTTIANANGKLSNNVTSTTVTYSIGDNTANAPKFAGVIQNGTGTAEVTAITKVGSNTQTLSGANTYTGATSITAGKLNITGSLANTAVSVTGTGALGGTGTIAGGVTIGDPTAGLGKLDLVDGSTGTLSLTGTGGLTLGGSAAGSTLNFEVAGATGGIGTGDKVAVTNAFTLNGGGATINITSLGVAANATYTLMTYGSETGLTLGSGSATLGNLTLANPSLSFGVSGTLTVTGSAIQLVTTGATAPATAFWSGANGTSWSSNSGGNGNFTSDSAGTTFLQSLPGASTDVSFYGTGATNLTNTLGTGLHIKSLTFLATIPNTATPTSPVTINGDGNTLTVDTGGLTVQNGAGAVTIGANIAGPGALANAGTLTLAGTNSYAGGTTLTAGTLTLGSTTALGSTSGTLAVNGGTLDLNGNSQTAGTLSGSGGTITNNSSSANATLTTSNAGNSSYAGILSDGTNGKTLGLAKGGSGTLTLSGSNAYSGGTSITGGILQLGSSTAMGTGSFTMTSGTTLDLDGQTITNALTLTGTGATGTGGALINSNTSTTAVVNADMLSSPSFTVGGAGNITLQRVQSSGTFTLTDASSGTLTLGTSSTTNHNNLLSLVVSGGGTVLLNMPANFIAIDRGLTISNGTVQFTGASTDEITTGGVVTINGGSLDFNGHADTGGIGALVGTGGMVTNTAPSTNVTVLINTTTTNTYAGTITDGAGAGVITVAVTGSGGIETFSGSNNYSGGTTVSGGAKLIMGSANALGSVAAPLAVNASTLDLNGHNLAVTTLNGTGATGVITSSGNTGATFALTANSGTNATYAGEINNGTTATPDILSLVKNGSNTLILSGSGTYSGGTAINAGTISQSAAGALGTGTITLGDGSTSTPATLQGTAGSTITNTNPIVIASGGTGNYTIKQTTGSDYDFTGPVTLNNPVTLETTANGAMFINGQITGSSLITIDGGNSTTKFVDFGGNNATTFTGNLLIQNKGSFKTITNGLGASTTVTMDSSGTVFDTGAASVTVGGFNDVVPGAGGSTIINAGGGSILTLAGSGSYSFSGAITNSGSLVKSGSGTQTLAGSSSYIGTTSVNGGTLLATNTSGSATGTGNVTVKTTAFLGGTGTITGSVAVNAGGTIFTGLSSSHTTAATLNVGPLTLAGNAIVNLTALPASTPGIGSADEIVSSGLLTYGGTLTVSDPNSLSYAAGDTFDLFGFASETGTFSSSPTLPTLGAGLIWNTSLLYSNGIISVGSSGPANLFFTGSAGNGNWDVASTTNFTAGAGAVVFHTNDNVTFDDTVANSGHNTGYFTIAVAPGGVVPTSMTVSGTTPYTFSGGNIGSGSTTSLTVANGASMTFDRGAGSRVTLELGSLSNSGLIDLKNNTMVLHNANSTIAATVQGELQTGFNGGGWNGTIGIKSSSAAGSSLYTLGNVYNSTTGDLTVAYTYYGDADLSGTVDGSDYSIIDANNGLTSGGTWQTGDFNYDGHVDGSDYSLIDNAFNTQNGDAVTAAQVAVNTSEIAGDSAAVPEPASLGLIGIGALGLMSRRRRRA